MDKHTHTNCQLILLPEILVSLPKCPYVYNITKSFLSLFALRSVYSWEFTFNTAISTKTGFPEIPSARILLALAASTVNPTLAKMNLNITHQNALEFRVLY